MSGKKFGEIARKAAENAPKGYSQDWPPNGKYFATIVFTNHGKTQNGGKPKIGLRFIVDCGEHEGKTAWANQTFSVESEASMGIFFGMFTALGVGEDFFDKYDEDTQQQMIEDLAALVVGRRASITVGNGRDANGQQKQEVKFVNPLPDNAPKSNVEAPKGKATGPAGAPKPSFPTPPAGGPARPSF